MRQHALQCPECGSPRMELVGEPGKRYYRCTAFPECQCKHGSHADGTPLGIPGDRATRRARVRAHHVFDSLWKTGRMTRNQAYGVLQKIMKMNRKEAHIGKFNLEQCEKMIREIVLMGSAIDILVDPDYNEHG